MVTRSIVSLSCLLFLSVCCSALRAAEEDIDPVGRPVKFSQGDLTGYAVWYEDSQWHVSMTTNDRSRGKNKKKAEKAVFTGTITVNKGRIAEGSFEGLEVAMKAKELPDSDWIRMHKDKKGFDFHFTTKGRTDSLKFKVIPGSEIVTFNLLTSGDGEPKRIMVGAKSENPKKVPFDLPAHPKEKEKESKKE